MSGRKVTISGFPRSMSNVKLKLCIEGASGSNTVDGIQKQQEQQAVCTFKNERGLRKFLDANLTETEFGGRVYHLKIDTIVKEPFSFGEQVSASQLKKVSKLDPNLERVLYQKTNYWSTLQKLPAEGGTKCILTQNIHPTATIHSVKLHFASKKRANGGPVAGLIRLPDGLLVLFEDPNDSLSCSEMDSQKFGDKTIVIFPKMVPEYYERKFVIEGMRDQINEDVLKMYLESCTKNEATPISCNKQAIPGVYLIEYDTEFDVSETSRFLKKISLTKLEGSKLSAKALLKTDCLKVSGIPDDITNDNLKFIFQSKKRSDGGLVTRIDRLPNQAALVYFALFTDAEHVYEKSQHENSSVLVDKRRVSIQTYHHALANDHNNIVQNYQTTLKPVPGQAETKKTLQAFQTEASCDQVLLDYVLQSKIHREAIEKHFQNLAQIQTYPKDDEKIVLKFTPQKVYNLKLSQKDFDEKCLLRFNEFLKNYSRDEKTYDLRKLQRARELKLYPELDKDFKDINVSLRWSPDEPKVVVIGKRDRVEHHIRQVDKLVNCTNIKVRFTENKFRTLLHCGVVDELQKDFPEVRIKCDEMSRSITYSGPDEVVQEAQCNALTLLEIDKMNMAGVDEMVLKFLSKSMQRSTEITSEIQQELKRANVKALIGVGPEPFIRAKTDDDYQRAMNIIKSLIVMDNMKPEKNKLDVIKTHEWKSFEESLANSRLFEIFVKPTESILIVGLKKEVKVARAKISGFMDKHAILSYFVNMDYGKARFAIEKAPAFTPSTCKRYDITCELSSNEGGGIIVRGKRKSLEYARSEIAKLQTSILEKNLVLERPGIKEFFQSKEGKEFLSTAERCNKVIILVGSNQCKEWLDANERSKLTVGAIEKWPSSSAFLPMDFNESELCFTFLRKSPVRVSVWKTDITRHKCEAIMNTSNEDLKLLPGGISGSILKLDVTKKIQDEMDGHISKNGKLLPGKAVITTAGDLTNCKKIVHVVGPRWKDKEYKLRDPKKVLKACVARGLESADKERLKSVAIPAISCGVFGGEIPVCIPLIIAAVEEYFSGVKSTEIKEVHFVEHSNQAVLDAFRKSLIGYNADKEVVAAAMPKVQVVPLQSLQQTTAAAQGSVQVQLVVGDISMQKTDVIVNVTNPQCLTNMRGGPVIGKALARTAGKNVVQECARLPLPHNVGDVFETNAEGLQCKKLYHALVTDYDQQKSSSIIQSVMAKSLQKADNAGYSSITFPAIATGGFNHPPQFVAKIMKQEIENFNGPNLQNVVIVLYEKSHKVISEFQTEFNLPLEQASQQSFNRNETRAKKNQSSGGNSSFHNDALRIGKLPITFNKGDITKQDSDVIVNSTNNKFALDQGQVSKKILEEAGQQILNEVQKAKPGDHYVVSSGGNMKCKKIIHMASPNNAKDLPKRISKVLHEVEKQQMKSVCLPAFGTGMLGLAVDEVGSIMRTSIEEFEKKNTKLNYLEMISIVLFDEDKLKKFKTGFFKKSFLEKVIEFTGLTGLFSSSIKESPIDSISSLTLYLYSNYEAVLDQAKKDISDGVNRNIVKKPIYSKMIGHLTEWEKFEINEIKNKYQIAIEFENDLDRLTLEGMIKDVTMADEEVSGILTEFSNAKTTSTYVSWEKKVNGYWKKYSPRSAHILEQAFKTRKSGETQNTVKVPEFKVGKVKHTTVNLATLDRDHRGLGSPKIKRRILESKSDDLPDQWDDMGGQNFIKVKLGPNSKEYKDVEQKLQASGSFYSTIVSIERIQNRSLYMQYIAKKKEVTNKLKNFSTIERQLFHGTAEDEKIILNGFDRSYAGKNATRYGKGVYFAVNARYSNTYAPPNQQGQRRMFVADVITGEYCVGHEDMKAPQKPNSDGIYDSAVDDSKNIRIFVVFKDASAYPTYRVTYISN